MHIQQVHHIAIICSDYEASKHFYVNILGFSIVRETFRESRNSYKLDLAIGDSLGTMIELFSFPEPPSRPTQPEACGLRHLALGVTDLNAAVSSLNEQGIPTEDIRHDPLTQKRFTFFRDPDDLPLEFYELA